MTRSKTALAALAVSLAAAAPALAADVSGQTTVAKAGQKSPVTVLGTGVKQGSTLAKGQSIVARTVSLSGSEQPKLTLSCPAGRVVKGAAPGDGPVGFTVTSTDYPGARTVKVRAYAKADGGSGSAKIYALCGKKKQS